MDTILQQFIDTLDASLKRLERQAGGGSGFARLTISQLHYLDAIHRLGEPTLTDLAERMGLSRASVTAGVQRLMALGFVDKRRSSLDLRVYHVRLTPTAEGLVRARAEALQQYEVFIRSALTAEEAGQFEAILRKLVRYFEAQESHRGNQ